MYPLYIYVLWRNQDYSPHAKSELLYVFEYLDQMKSSQEVWFRGIKRVSIPNQIVDFPKSKEISCQGKQHFVFGMDCAG